MTPNGKDTRGAHCLVCGRQFNRGDSLRRHAQVHTRVRPRVRSKKRACLGCQKSKIRCDGARPNCSACARRNARCLYNQEVMTSNEVSNAQPEWLEYNSYEISRPEIAVGSGDNAVEEDSPSTSNQYTSSTSREFQSCSPDTSLPGTLFEPGIGTGFDWIFHENMDDIYPWATSTTIQQSMSTMVPISNDISLSQRFESTLLSQPSINRSASMNSENSPIDEFPVPEGDHSGPPDDRWPMEWAAVPPQVLTLPALGESNSDEYRSTHFSLSRLGSHGSLKLKNILQVPFERHLWPTVSMPEFPDGEKLDHCIDLYFLYFDKWVPIIHRATFDPARDPALTLVIIAIGACYTDFECAQGFSMTLSELSRRLLAFMGEHDPRFVRSEGYVAAQLLNSIYCFSSGSKRLYELAERNRGSLVNIARCMNLFNHREMSESSNAGLEARWEIWLQAEKYRRLGWAVFVYDASAASMRNVRPCISLHDIKMSMPSLSKQWKAESAQAWAALHPWTTKGPQADSFEACMRNVVKDPKIGRLRYKDNYHVTIVLATLNRMIWNNKEATTHQGAPFLSSYAALIAERAELLEIMDHFISPPHQQSCQATRLDFDIEASTQQLVLIRISHMLAADEICDYLGPIWEGSNPARAAQACAARDRIVSWIQKKPEDFRSFTFSCAQVLAITRKYPYNHPQEAYNAFHGGMAVWVMSSLYVGIQRSCDRNEGISTTPMPVCNLDWLGPMDTPESLVIQDWIKHGTPCVVRMHGVPDIFSPLGPKQVLRQVVEVLGNISVWGVAKTFLNTAVRVLNA